MEILDIGEVAARTGASASTLRYYDEIGLIASVGRRGLRRQFGAETILRLALISLGRKAGFSLSQIAAMFGATGGGELPRESLRARADEIDRQIKDLTLLGEMLRHVADCAQPSHFDCPRFQKLLRVALRPGRRG